jgi:hypothetical protein
MSRHLAKTVVDREKDPCSDDVDQSMAVVPAQPDWHSSGTRFGDPG